MVSAALLDVSSIADEALHKVLVSVAHGQVESLCIGAIEQGQSIDMETSDCSHDVVAVVLADHDVGPCLGALLIGGDRLSFTNT